MASILPMEAFPCVPKSSLRQKPSLKVPRQRTGEMAQPIRIFDNLVEDQGSVPSSHIVAHNQLASANTAHVWYSCIQAGETTHTCKIKLNMS